MEKLSTPFGAIEIRIDGKPVPFFAQEEKPDVRCPHVLGRYRIGVRFIPDGEAHTVACVFEPGGSYERTPESGERLECQSFYNDRGFKLSIGLACEAGYIGGARASDQYDYDAAYPENGMAFLIGQNTKTERYVFGVAWIDNVDRDDTNNRDVETWYGADPTYFT